MLITLISREKIYDLLLPEKISGKYYLVSPDLPSWTNKLISFEADSSGFWKTETDENVILYDETGQRADHLFWSAGKLYPVEILNKNAGIGRSFILVENNTPDKNEFQKYRMTGDASLKIGRSSDSHIRIFNQHVSGDHATLGYHGGVWSVVESEGTNGTYLNGTRIKGNVTLSGGDTLYILGVRIVIGNDFIAINNPDGTVTINTDILVKYAYEEVNDDRSIKIPDDAFFYRSPRFVRHFDPIQLVVDAPTKQAEGEDMPIFFTIGPSMMMGVASFSAGIISFINTRNNGGSVLSSIPTLLTCTSMLICMIVFPFIMRRIERKKKKEKEIERRDKYHSYLDRLNEEIESQCRIQKEILNENSPSILDYTNTQDFWDRKLWERSQTDDDFLVLRLGIGNVPMYGEVKFPQERFGIEEDVLRDELKAFENKERLLYDIPVCFPVKEGKVLGIVGDRESRMKLLNNILLQICLLHSYDEVKIICIYDESDEKYLLPIRYAQHVWDNDGRNRYIAVNDEDVRQLSITISKIVRDSMERPEEEKRISGPHYVIVSTSKVLSNKCSFMSDICSENMPENFSLICSYDSIKELPKECRTVADVNAGHGVLTSALGGGRRIGFVCDDVKVSDTAVRIRRMASEQLDLNHGKYELPKMLTFMDMFGTGKLEFLNIPQRWKVNDPIRSLKTPVGVDTNGETFYLDLHEKVHGPHGLVAGMTGSGKSEFIITYILSLAVNYHPDEVAFVLIDYKGGGLAGAFDNEKYRLPHLAGTITNLDSSAVTRSILSISSELKRRQRIFNEARVIANEGTMDIYKYQKMYREGLVKDPLPHLFIISDEFAELKTQQPEFMEQLISTARIGRSLGVHLILATQKPAGVVNEQIWANSRFKVCLKVQDRADSMDMLKRPDAASIAETGRFFLQVGYNELFEMGQSAWCGAGYTGEDKVASGDDMTIEVVDDLGTVTDTLKGSKVHTSSENGKQIVRIMEYLDRLAKEDHIEERQLWLPDLNSVILYDDIVRSEEFEASADCLEVLLGMLDDPYHQDQRRLTLNMTEIGNTIIYDASGSGSEMMLETILYSAYSNYGPDRLCTYILDFGSESLRMFEKAPSTKQIAVDGDDGDISEIFSMIRSEIVRRKKLVAQFGGDLRRYNSSSDKPIPFMIVIVNNLSHFTESYQAYEEMMISLTRDCAKYGIYFIVTANSASAVRYRLGQNFQKSYALQLNDPTDYTSIFGKLGGIYPPNILGRGIIAEDEIYIYQTASIVPPEKDLFTHVNTFCEELRKITGDTDNVSSSGDLSSEGYSSELSVIPEDFGEFPIGVTISGRVPFNIDMKSCNILHAISENGKDAMNFAAGIVEAAHKIPGIEIVMINPDKDVDSSIMVPHSSISVDDAAKEIERLILIGIDRNNSHKKDGVSYDESPILVVVNRLDMIKEKLSPADFSNLSIMLQKVEGFTGMFFLVTGSFTSVSKYSAADWYLDRVNGTGLLIGNNIDKQNWLKFEGRTDRGNNILGKTSGFYVRDGFSDKLRIITKAVK